QIQRTIMRTHFILAMLFVALCPDVFGQTTNTNSPITNRPPIAHTNSDQSTSVKTDGDRIPQVSVGPFIIQGGPEGKKQESDSILISILKVIIWPGLFACLVLFFKQEISTFLGKIKSVKAKD